MFARLHRRVHGDFALDATPGEFKWPSSEQAGSLASDNNPFVCSIRSSIRAFLF